MKVKTMNDVADVVDFIKVYYPTNSNFIEDEFGEICGGYFDDKLELAFKLLSKNSRIKVVDLYELLAVITLLNGDEYSKRLEFIF